MAGNNLQISSTGLDHLYINGLPIIEAEINISDVFKKIARITSLAVNTDPYFSSLGEAARLLSESHGEGDRITSDFLEEGAKELRPIFTPFQRFIPDGAYETTVLEYEFLANGDSDFLWNNTNPLTAYINSIQVKCNSGSAILHFWVDGTELGSVSLPVVTSNYLAYDLAGFLGGIYSNYTARENVRNNNIAQVLEVRLENPSVDFDYDVKISGMQFDAIGWKKALTECGDVVLPSYDDNIRISSLIKSFEWSNKNNVKIKGVTLKHNCGGAYVRIAQNGVDGDSRYLNKNTVGEDYFSVTEDINSISVTIDGASDDFNYDLIINTELPNVIPSPRFEYDSSWNEGKIIFRYQNMDTRCSSDKLNYTSETLKHTRVDPNIFDEVLKYLEDSLKNYVLKEWYEAIGYSKKAAEYARKYEFSRAQAKFWVRSEKGLQTNYMFAGV